MKNKISTLVMLCLSSIVLGQMNTYDTKIKLNGISEQWHTVTLPTTIFKTSKADLSDVRIYGIREKDTLEAPYILNTLASNVTQTPIPFKLINTVTNENGYYSTYKVAPNQNINTIKLDISNLNFDWRVVLEGSEDKTEWFTILKDYRILAIKNEQTNYTFTDLLFPNTNYTYYRLSIQSKDTPDIQSASVLSKTVSKAQYHIYTPESITTVQENKSTILTIDFNEPLSLSHIQLKVAETYDYYRPISIAYAYDSIQTEKGIRYSYKNIASGTLSSLELNDFKFSSIVTQKLKIIIRNDDNVPLTITPAKVEGYVHTLTARFTDKADYYLVYGKKQTYKPQYDIAVNTANIPEKIQALSLGRKEDILKKETLVIAPLFKNKWWLWGIMGIIILVLGGFTFKMLQKK